MSATPAPYRHQPTKTLQILWQLVAIPLWQLPKWLLAAVPVMRSKKKGSWNLPRHLTVSLLRHVIRVSNDVGLILVPPKHNHRAVDGPDGIWISPLPDHFIMGEIKTRADAHGVTSIPIPGYWIHKTEDLKPNIPPYAGEKVLFHLHGGAFSVETAHPSGGMSAIPRGYLQHTPFLRRTFAVEYRLSTSSPLEPTNPFPAALLDTLAGYIHLVNLGFAEKDIIISGDSAGSQLAIGLTKYLIDNKHHLPELPSPPGALVLLSAWTDMSECFIPNPSPQSSQVRMLEYDWLGTLHKGFYLYSATGYVGHLPGDIEDSFTSAYISPTSPQVLGLLPGSQRSISFKGFPRTWIDVGGFEGLMDQVERLRDAMVEDMGVDMVYYNEVDGGVHDYLSFSGHEPDRTRTFKQIAKWLEDER